MSVNMYLKPEVTKLSDFKFVGDGTGKLLGMNIFIRDGRHYIMWSLDSEVPDVLTEVLDEFSLYESFPAYGGREMGVYEYESAKATIDLVDDSSGKRSAINYRVHLTAKKLEDARELIHLFRTGESRPTESYQGLQAGMSRAELEAEVQRLTENVNRRGDKIENIRRAVNSLLDHLEGGLLWRWFGGSVSRKVRTISAIIG